MARKLETIAKWINENTEYRAVIHRTTVNTDRPIPKGLCYRTHVGKGRVGLLLEVYNKNGELRYQHNSAETYRNNQEVEHWIKDGMPEQYGNWRVSYP